MVAEGHQIRSATYRGGDQRGGGKVGKIGCRGVRWDDDGKS